MFRNWHSLNVVAHSCFVLLIFSSSEAPSLLSKHPDRSHPNITGLHLLPTNYPSRPKKIKFPKPSDPDLDIEVDDDETQTDGMLLIFSSSLVSDKDYLEFAYAPFSLVRERR